MNIIDFVLKKIRRNHSEASVSVQFDTPDLMEEQVKDQAGIDMEIEYAQLSTSGDENVCPMCAQFEGKIFPRNNAPKLPLCPNCACCYEYYYKSDLPPNAIISDIADFILPAECTSLFYKHQHQLYKETDTDKIIRICESDLKKLPEFMTPYLSAGFPAPDELACRDILPGLYMELGKWEKAEKAIKKCMEAKAYYPDDGSDALSRFISYRKIATEVLEYIQHNPGFLQRKIYKVFPYEGEEKELLKDFLRNSRQIKKVKSGNTNELYCE